jgi:glycosyltransferase involved in cell wall biosynthesis
MNQQHTALNRPITVVMATFNGAKYIAAQIDSIIAQTLAPNEIIICDDASTDETISILQKYQEQGLIQLHQNPVNIGIVANFKKAVSLAKEGNEIAFADQDDVWMNDKLEILSAAMAAIAKNHQPSLVYSDLKLVDKELNLINPSFWQELNHQHHQHCFATLLYGNFVTGCTVLIDPNMRPYFLSMPEENILHDVWMAFIAFGFGNVRAISKPLVMYRQHEKNENYREGFAKKTKWQERRRNLRLMFSDSQYLNDELKIAAVFFERYHAQLSEDKKAALQKFMLLKDQSFFKKYFALKKAFKNKWGRPTDY